MLGLSVSGKSVHREVKPKFSMFSSLMTRAGLEKSAAQVSGTSRFCYRVSYFSFSLAQWASAQASCPPTK